MNRFWAMLAMGFLGLNLVGCGGGDIVSPDSVNIGQPTEEQLKQEAQEAAEAEKLGQ